MDTDPNNNLDLLGYCEDPKISKELPIRCVKQEFEEKVNQFWVEHPNINRIEPPYEDLAVEKQSPQWFLFPGGETKVFPILHLERDEDYLLNPKVFYTGDALLQIATLTQCAENSEKCHLPVLGGALWNIRTTKNVINCDNISNGKKTKCSFFSAPVHNAYVETVLLKLIIDIAESRSK